MQIVVLFFILNVNVCVPILPVGIITESGETGKFASVMATKPVIAELKLYLSGLPKVTLYGKLKLMVELHKSTTVPTVKYIVGATVIVTALLTVLVHSLVVQVAVYEVVILGLTEILVPIEALLQTTVPEHSLAVKVTI